MNPERSMQRIKKFLVAANNPAFFRIIIFIYISLWIVTVVVAHTQKFKNAPHLPFLAEDSLEYLNLSESLRVGEFQLQDFSYPETFRVPGYPLFLLVSSFFTYSYFISTLLQILLSFFTAFLVIRITQAFIDKNFATYAGLLYLVSPLVILYSLLGFSEILFNACLISILYLLTYLRLTSNLRLVAIGMLWGFSVLVRPISCYFFVVITLVLLYELWRKYKVNNFRLLCKVIGIPLFSGFLVLTPWIIRNHEISGVYGLSSLQGYNLMYYNLSMFRQFQNNLQIDNVRSMYEKELDLPSAQWRDIKNSKKISKVVFNDLQNNLMPYSFFHFSKIPQLFFSSSIETSLVYLDQIFGFKLQKGGVSLMDDLIKGNWSTALKKAFSVWWKFGERILWIIVYICAVIGLVSVKDFKFKLISILYMGYFSILTGPVALARYRVPLEPLIFILTIIGLHHMLYSSNMKGSMYSFYIRIKTEYPRLNKVFKYLISGGLAAFVDLGLLYVLSDLLHVWYLIAATLAFILAFFVSFFLQKYWTFGDGSQGKIHKQMTVYFIIAIVNLGINTLLMFIVVDWLHLYYMFAQFLIAGLIAVWSYFLYKIFVFTQE